MKGVNRPGKWFVWGILVIPYLIVYFHRLTMGVLRETLIAEFGLSAVSFANIGAVYFYTYALLQIPAGMMADSLGPRKTIVGSTLIAAAGSLIFALAPDAGMLYLGRFVIGVGVAAVFVAILKVVAISFDEAMFATMAGLTAAIGNLGGLLAQTPLQAGISRFGWRGSFIFIAAIGAGAALLCHVFLSSADDKFQAIRERFPDHHPSLKNSLLSTVMNPRTWPPFLQFVGVYGSFVALTGSWGQGYLSVRYGLSAHAAAGVMMYPVLGLSISGILFSKMCDYLKMRKIPMLIFGSGYAAGWLVFFFIPPTASPASLSVLLFAIGFFSGVFVLSLPIGKEVNHPDFSGISTAFVNVGGFMGAALIPLLMGKILDLRIAAGEPAAYRVPGSGSRGAAFSCRHGIHNRDARKKYLFRF